MISIRFGTPRNEWFRLSLQVGPPWFPTRMVIPRFTRDVDELQTWANADIRRLLAAQAIQDMLAEEDRRFIQTVADLC